MSNLPGYQVWPLQMVDSVVLIYSAQVVNWTESWEMAVNVKQKLRWQHSYIIKHRLNIWITLLKLVFQLSIKYGPLLHLLDQTMMHER